jgi:two-component system torCAD operon response regulator TorR
MEGVTPQTRNPNDLDKVYVVDPEESVHDALRALLGPSGYQVTCYFDAESFIDSRVLTDTRDGLLLIEADLSGLGSIALIQIARQSNAAFSIIVLTSTSDRDIAAQVIRAGATKVLEKPLLQRRLLPELRTLLPLVGDSEKTISPRNSCGNAQAIEREFPHAGEMQ